MLFTFAIDSLTSIDFDNEDHIKEQFGPEAEIVEWKTRFTKEGNLALEIVMSGVTFEKAHEVTLELLSHRR